jgi:hypothetical protein
MAGNECLQYYTGTTGSFSSFNYDTAGTTVPTITQQQHLASQDYSICFRSLLFFFFHHCYQDYPIWFRSFFFYCNIFASRTI